MKKTVFVLTTGILAAGSLASCGSNLGGTMGVGALQNLLFNASSQGFNILGNPQEFMTNALIESAMPEELRKVNNTLESVGLGNLVKKEKQYIAEAAKLTVNTSKPIVTQAIREMTVTDAINIASGGKGAATAYLKNKTREKLIDAIQPQVDAKLNEYGIVKSVNTALTGSSISGILGTILGTDKKNNVNATSPITRLASEQMVNGLFYVIENYEVNNVANPNAWK
ncbi:DUF4197 family protein [Elizabethkingia anophelis]|nr:DUF4197 family protein [Elizabethkingia anophelis]MCT4058787.1 DUF4197 family protein [Elizabethkingia anophelis]MCT4069396.1 DUF4197 family protein [Elizabethkingia anophelis]MDV3799528.1 hypothetical protein [Elizabethkingia anophelis]